MFDLKREWVPAEHLSLNGKLFCPGDADLRALKMKAHKLNLDYNKLYDDQVEERNAIIHEILGEMGTGCTVQAPAFFHYGCHTKLGDRVFINFNFMCQDDAFVEIGDDCNIGPNCTIVTPIHPLVPEERKLMQDKDGNPIRLCYAKPVVIGENCWFGANVTVCGGVTVGKNCVIGAGAVITKDILDGVFAAGVPCRVIREITEADSMANFPEIAGEYRPL